MADCVHETFCRGGCPGEVGVSCEEEPSGPIDLVPGESYAIIIDLELERSELGFYNLMLSFDE